MKMLYAVSEALEALGGMSRSALYQRLAAGELSAVKVGRRTYFTHEELERFVRTLSASEESETSLPGRGGDAR